MDDNPLRGDDHRVFLNDLLSNQLQTSLRGKSNAGKNVTVRPAEGAGMRGGWDTAALLLKTNKRTPFLNF